jgi:hypothetical protein
LGDFEIIDENQLCVDFDLRDHAYFLSELCNAKLIFLNLLRCGCEPNLRGVRTCFASDAGLDIHPPAIEMARCRRAGFKTKGIVK